MITAKCNRCGGTALGKTFEDASKKINHAVGLGRGIKCGDNYNQVKQVGDSTPTDTPKTDTPKTDTSKESIFNKIHSRSDKKTETKTKSK